MSEGTPLTRVSALAAPVLIFLLLSVGTFVGVVRYTTVFDPAVGLGGSMPTDATHHDPKPCLRYPSAPLASTIETAARALHEGGLTSQDLSDVVGDLYARANAREAALHAATPADEHLEAFSRGSGLFSRLVIALKRDRLRAQLALLLTATPAMKRTVASLPEKQRAAVEAQWTRDPSVFVLPGLLELIRQMKLEVTRAKLDVVQAKLEAQIAAGLIPSLEALRAEDPNQTLDGWERELTLARTADDEFTVSSFGGYQTPGSGYDEYLVRKLKVSQRESPPPEPSAPCTGKTELTVERAELDTALLNVEELSKRVRVRPEFSGGVMIGFKLTKLGDAFLQHAGLCEGDVVSSLNGASLGSPDKALEAYSRIRDAKRVEIEVIRGGVALTLVVTVR